MYDRLMAALGTPARRAQAVSWILREQLPSVIELVARELVAYEEVPGIMLALKQLRSMTAMAQKISLTWLEDRSQVLALAVRLIRADAFSSGKVTSGMQDAIAGQSTQRRSEHLALTVATGISLQYGSRLRRAREWDSRLEKTLFDTHNLAYSLWHNSSERVEPKWICEVVLRLRVLAEDADFLGCEGLDSVPMPEALLHLL